MRSGTVQRAWRGAALALVGGLWALLLAGCPPTAGNVVCGAGMTACGEACVDLRTSTASCGACGSACGALEVCQEGACECREGSVLCGGACVDLEADSRNCGACGSACGAGTACDRGTCRPVLHCGSNTCVGADACEGTQCVCPPGRTLCGGVCVDLSSSLDHCGACGSACDDVQACRGGVCTYDAVAACGTTGQLVGLRTSGRMGPPVQLPGPMLQCLGADRDALLVGETDGDVQRVARARLALQGRDADTGQSPNHILVDAPWVFVVESLENSLLVYRRDEGGPLTLLAQLPLGEGTSPQAAARVGDTLFVPLYGGVFTEAQARLGQRVARVDVSDPAHPRRGEDISLLGLDLQTFPGEQSFPYPYGITVFNGALYLPLSNLNPTTFKPGGPGLLAKVDPQTGAVSRVALDAERCLNAGYALPVGEQLAVSCLGRLEYGQDGNITAVEKTGLVLLDAADRRVATFPLACPAGDTTCVPPGATRFAVRGSRVYLGDVNGGRVFVLEATGSGLAERRGFAGSEGGPLAACPAVGHGVVNTVADIASIP